jgi:hypothetical protein
VAGCAIGAESALVHIGVARGALAIKAIKPNSFAVTGRPVGRLDRMTLSTLHTGVTGREELGIAVVVEFFDLEGQGCVAVGTILAELAEVNVLMAICTVRRRV